MIDNPPGSRLLAFCREQIERDGSRSTAARGAFRVFHDAWYDRVARWARLKTGASGVCDNEDLVVATFWKCWQWAEGGAGMPDDAVALRTCLQRAHSDCMRQAFGHAATNNGQRDDTRHPVPVVYMYNDDPDTLALIESLAGLDEVEATVIASTALEDYLSALPPNLSAVVEARFVAGYSVAEAGAQLGLTPDQVKKRTAQGLALLAQRVLAAERPASDERERKK